MKRITTRRELVELTMDLGVRPDWHEPDEQNVTAVVRGSNFDNAGFWPHDEHGTAHVEKYIVLKQDGKDVVAVNLATLFAWATGYQD